MKKPRSIRAWAVLVWLAVWQAGSMALGKEILLVSPLRVLQRLGQLALTSEFWASIGSSVLRIGGGFLLASVYGVLLAALAARF